MVGTKSGQAAGKAVSARDALRDSFGVWTHVSVAGIGGPAKQIATMHRLAVEGKRWISEDGFFHALSYCIALPGPETQQLAIYVGWLANRTIGGVIAGGLFILPARRYSSASGRRFWRSWPRPSCASAATCCTVHSCSRLRHWRSLRRSSSFPFP